MNCLSETRRRMLDQLGQAQDWRSEEQKLADAVARHLANIGLHICLASDSGGNTMIRGNALEAARASAIHAFDDSQAELYRRVEDLCLIDPRKLGKALTYAIT